MKTILVVEDEKLIRQGLMTMIRRAPTPVETILEARNGLEALELLNRQPVDLLITDIRMPGMDGLELVAKARLLPHPPLAVVVSGYDDFNYAVEMMRGGVRDYLLKPVERQKLWDLLQKMEEEWKRAGQEQANAAQTRRRALRYLMLDNQMPPAERAALQERYGKEFPTEPYCLFYARQAPEGLPSWEILRDICGASACLVPVSAALPAMRAGVSAAHTGLDELPVAYGEATAAYWQAFFAEAPRVWRSGEWTPCSTPVPEKEPQKIVQMLGVSRWREASAALRALVEQVRAGQLAPAQMAQATEQLTSQLLATYRTMLEPDAELTALSDLWQYDDAEAYLAAARAWMEEFTNRLLHEFDDYRNKQKIRDAVIYIQQNYATSLNMAVVSNQVSMNYSLFSLLFKQYVGTNFVAYLQNLRLDEARRLLRETDLRVNEIGRKVGFADDKNFLKVFKTACGVSPSEYRKNQQFAEES